MTESTRLLLDLLDECPLPVEARIRIERRIVAHDDLRCALIDTMHLIPDSLYGLRARCDAAVAKAEAR